MCEVEPGSGHFAACPVINNGKDRANFAPYGGEIGGAGMGKYIIKRILIAIPVLIGITIIDYAIMCLAGSRLRCFRGQNIRSGGTGREIALGLDQLSMYSILFG